MFHKIFKSRHREIVLILASKIVQQQQFAVFKLVRRPVFLKKLAEQVIYGREFDTAKRPVFNRVPAVVVFGFGDVAQSKHFFGDITQGRGFAHPDRAAEHQSPAGQDVVFQIADIFLNHTFAGQPVLVNVPVKRPNAHVDQKHPQFLRAKGREPLVGQRLFELRVELFLFYYLRNVHVPPFACIWQCWFWRFPRIFGD